MKVPKNIDIIVHDWNPNGTNDISLMVDGELQPYSLDEATFGIDINKYGAFEIAEGCYAAIVPLKKVIQMLALSPTRSGTEAFNRLNAYLNGGAK